MPTAVYLNNTELGATFGMFPNTPDRLFGPTVSYPAVPIATRIAPLVSTPASYGEKSVTLKGIIAPAAATAAALASALTDLQDLVYQGQVTLRIDNGGGTIRDLLGVTTRWEPTPNRDWIAARACQFQWTLRALEGTWRSPSPEIIPLAAGIAAAIPVGTAASGWIATVAGSPSNPFTLTFKKASGELITTMSFAVGLTSAEYMIIDGGALTVQKVTSGGAPTNAISVLTGNFPPRGINPEDAWRAGVSYPTVTLSTGFGDLFTWPRWLG